MSLGFSVEALLPNARVSGPLRMGLLRVTEADWLASDADLEPRNAVFDAYPESAQVLPEASDAEAELAAMLDIDGGLEQIARQHWEDFCILTQDTVDVPFRFTGAAVGFPTDWQLSEKMGKALGAVHEPIDGYADQLSGAVDHFLEGLRSPDIFGRTNAFVMPSSDWRYLPVDDPEERFSHVTPENAGETLFVRCERETLRRLPKTGAIVFTIGVHVAQLGSLSRAAIERVAQTLDGFMEGENTRRAAPQYAAALKAYAKQRNAGRKAA